MNFQVGEKVAVMVGGSYHGGYIAVGNNCPATNPEALVSFDHLIENCEYSIVSQTNSFIYSIPVEDLERIDEPIISLQECHIKPSGNIDISGETTEEVQCSLPERGNSSVSDLHTDVDKEKEVHLDMASNSGVYKKRELDGQITEECSGFQGKPRTSSESGQYAAHQTSSRVDNTLGKYRKDSKDSLYSSSKYANKPYERVFENSESENALRKKVENAILSVLTQAETICQKDIPISDDNSSVINEMRQLFFKLQTKSEFLCKNELEVNVDHKDLQGIIRDILCDSEGLIERLEDNIVTLEGKVVILEKCEHHVKLVKRNLGETGWLERLEILQREVKIPPYIVTNHIYTAIENLTTIGGELSSKMAQIFSLTESLNVLHSFNARIDSKVVTEVDSFLTRFKELFESVKNESERLVAARKLFAKFEKDAAHFLMDIKVLTKRLQDCSDDLSDYHAFKEVESKEPTIINDHQQLMSFKRAIENGKILLNINSDLVNRTFDNFTSDLQAKREIMDSIISKMKGKVQRYLEHGDIILKEGNLYLSGSSRFDSIDGCVAKGKYLIESLNKFLEKLSSFDNVGIPNFEEIIDENSSLSTMKPKLKSMQASLRKKLERLENIKPTVNKCRQELEEIQTEFAFLDSDITNDILQKPNAECKLTAALQTLEAIESRISNLRTKTTSLSVDYVKLNSVQQLYEHARATETQFLDSKSRLFCLLYTVKEKKRLNASDDEIGEDVANSMDPAPSGQTQDKNLSANTMANIVSNRVPIPPEQTPHMSQSLGNCASTIDAGGDRKCHSDEQLSQNDDPGIFKRIFNSLTGTGKSHGTVIVSETGKRNDSDKMQKGRAQECYDVQDCEDCREVLKVEGLQVGATVLFRRDKMEAIGSVKRIFRMGNEVLVGIAFDAPVGNCNGTYKTKRIFNCPEKHGIVISPQHLKDEKRFILLSSEKKSKPNEDLNKNEIISGVITLELPITLERIQTGRTRSATKLRGIQGRRNSCYIDTCLFSMFAFTNIFDYILESSEKDDEMCSKVKKILKKDIVNPLRKNLFCPAEGVNDLRQAMLKLCSKLAQSYMDSEEFLFLLLDDVLHLENFIEFKDSSDYMHQVFLEPELIGEPTRFTTTQVLFEMSFCVCDILFQKVPHPAFIIEMPRSDGQLKYCDRIVPCRYLNISDLMVRANRKCCLCQETASYQCKSCFGLIADEPGIKSTYFCTGCLFSFHKNEKRKEHSHEVLGATNSVSSEEKLKLLAVLCIKSNHYVCFVRCEHREGAKWIFFDSDPSGGNSRMVVLEDDFEDNLIALEKSQNHTLGEWEKIPQMMKRMLTDIYICIYVKPDEL